MAAESIGYLVPTKIPGYSDAADIQAALRLYHYGDYDYDPANTSTANLVNPSLAYSINYLQTQIDNISSGGITANIFTAKGQLISSSSTATISILSSGTNNQILTVNTATATGLQWTSTLIAPTLTSPTVDGAGIIFEGSSADANETILNVVDPTADRTITLPDESGTVALRDVAFVLSSSTSYPLILADSYKMISISNASAITVTVPANTSVAFPTGTQINLLQRGAGQITVAGAVGVTINSSSTLKLRAQWSAATLIKIDTNTWVLTGDIE